MENKKIAVSFELILMIVSVFAFPYLIADTNSVFKEFDEEYKKSVEEGLLIKETQSGFNIGEFVITLLGELKKPMIPVVSASDEDVNFGCCEVSNEEILCSTISGDECNLDAGDFNNFTSCEATSFCVRGC